MNVFIKNNHKIGKLFVDLRYWFSGDELILVEQEKFKTTVVGEVIEFYDWTQSDLDKVEDGDLPFLTEQKTLCIWYEKGKRPKNIH